MVSTKTNLVFSVTASITASTDVASTKSMSMLLLVNVLNRLFVLPNRNELEIMWSPARKRENSEVPMAAIPVAKQAVAMPFSIAEILFSSAVTVGLTCRP